MTRRLARILQVVVIAAVAALLIAQLVVVPMVSGYMARAYPEFEWARWPLALSLVAVLACIQVALVGIWRLLGQVASDVIFGGSARRWVDLVLGALTTGWVLVLATSVWQTVENVSAPWILLMEVLGLLVGLAVLLLIVVMRGLLIRATELKVEMDAVV